VNPELAHRLLTLPRQVIDCPGDLFDGRAHPFLQPASRIRQGDTAGRPVKETHADTLFKLTHPMAQGRWRKAELLCCGPKTQVFGHRRKSREIGQVGAAHW
jgi:hypothetical protein